MQTISIHTPAPLTVVPTAAGFTIWEKSMIDLGFSNSLATVYSSNSQAEANAYLFAAAPEMKAAIEGILIKLSATGDFNTYYRLEILQLNKALSLCQIPTHPESFAPCMRKPPASCVTLNTNGTKLKGLISAFRMPILGRKLKKLGKALLKIR